MVWCVKGLGEEEQAPLGASLDHHLVTVVHSNINLGEEAHMSL